MELNYINKKIQVSCEGKGTWKAIITNKNEDTISFSLQGNYENFRPFRPGEIVTGVVFQKEKGVQFQGVIEKKILAIAPTYIISNVSYQGFVQKRSFNRLECSEEMTYTVNQSLIDAVSFTNNLLIVEERLDKDMKSGLMIDISAGGLKLFCEEEFSEGERIIVKFPIHGKNLIQRGTVSYKKMMHSPVGMRYFYGVRFEEIDEKTQEMIEDYVLQVMKRMGKQ